MRSIRCNISYYLNIGCPLLVDWQEHKRMKFVAVYTACSLLVIIIAAGQTTDHQSENGHSSSIDGNMAATSIYSDLSDSDVVDEVEEELESELELKRMLLYVTPLMGIFQKKKSETTRLNRRSPKELSYEGRKRGAGRRPPPMYNQYNKYSEEMQPDRSGYGGYSSSSSYGGGSSYGGSSYGCCDKKDDLLPILALLALSLLLLYLIAIATTTVAARRRRRVATDSNNNDLIDEDIQADIGIHHYIRIMLKLMRIDYGAISIYKSE